LILKYFDIIWRRLVSILFYLDVNINVTALLDFDYLEKNIKIIAKVAK
jgi:hypothetical protein